MQHVSITITLQHSLTIPKHHRLTLWHACVAHSCSTQKLEAYNSVERMGTFFKIYEQTLYIESIFLWMLAHSRPQARLQSQDTAKISQTIRTLLAPDVAIHIYDVFGAHMSLDVFPVSSSHVIMVVVCLRTFVCTIRSDLLLSLGTGLIHADVLRLDSCEVGPYDMPVCILSNVKCIQILIAVCTFTLSVCCKN